MQKNKIVSYLGFAIKSGNAIFGVDAAECTKKKVFLIMVSENISDNSFKTALKLQKKFKCVMIKTVGFSLGELISRENCKFVALTDKNLGEAITAVARDEDEFITYPREEQQ